MDRIITHLRSCGAVLVATHESPDGDALGSLLAMGFALESIGKKVTLYNESPIPAVYRYLPDVDRVVGDLNDVSRYDTTVILDCGDLYRVGRLADPISRIPTVINIDHHTTNTGFGRFQLVDVAACSSTELVYRLVTRMKIPVDSRIATAIYTGILTDTGSFRFSNTNGRAFSICAEMVEKRVDPYLVAQHVFGTYSLGRIKLLNLALDSIEISPNGKLSLMTLTRDMFEETDTQLEDVDGLINYAKRIEDVKIAAMIVEHVNGGPDCSEAGCRYHVSLRSDGSVDVAAIAAAFGGGGHTSAAGFGIEASLSEVRGRIYRLAETL
ncbi:MAG: DHH family phosphoesterase [Desulfobacterales bacterium]